MLGGTSGISNGSSGSLARSSAHASAWRSRPDDRGQRDAAGPPAGRLLDRGREPGDVVGPLRGIVEATREVQRVEVVAVRERRRARR